MIRWPAGTLTRPTPTPKSYRRTRRARP
jgi:hypothetical protein